MSHKLDDLEGRLKRGIRQAVESSRQQVNALAASLNALSPLAVLERGYSLSKRLSDGELIRDASTVSIGDQISTLFASGSIISEVRSIDLDE